MTLASLKKTQADRVLGIDASTNSIAFCLMENDVPLKWGKINLSGEDIYDKIQSRKDFFESKCGGLDLEWLELPEKNKKKMLFEITI